MIADEPLHVYTGVRWHLDSNVVDAPEAEDLRRLLELGWVRLSVGDQAHAEPMQNPDVYERLLPLLETFDVALGIAVLDHSVLDMCVLASEADVERFDRVYKALWPNRDQQADGQKPNKEATNRYRDAMHIDTAIRYGATGFVTEDRNVLKAADRVEEAFAGFLIVDIAGATSYSVQRARHVRHAASVHGRPAPATIPAWPA